MNLQDSLLNVTMQTFSFAFLTNSKFDYVSGTGGTILNIIFIILLSASIFNFTISVPSEVRVWPLTTKTFELFTLLISTNRFQALHTS